MRNIPMITKLTALGLMLALASALPSRAEDDPEWRFMVAPYFWAAGLDGDVTVKNRNVNVDMDFSDVWDALETGFLVHFEAQRGRWGAFVDMNYLNLSTDEEMTKSGAALRAELDTSQWILELCGLYTILDRELGEQGSGRSLTVDALAGGRYWRVDNELDLLLNVGGAVTEADFDSDESWVDPVVGARLQVDLTKRFHVFLRGDIGGFGLGESSDFTWSVMGLVGYRLVDWATIMVGYKSLDVDREEPFEADLNIHGPLAGVAFTF